MQRNIELQRKKRLKEYLRKIYRNRDPFVAQKSSQKFCIYDQRRWNQDFSPVKDNPEAFFLEAFEEVSVIWLMTKGIHFTHNNANYIMLAVETSGEGLCP